MTRSQRSLVARCKPSTPFAAPDHRKAGLFEAIANVVGGIGVVLDHETLHVQPLPSKSIRQSRAGTPLNAAASRSWRRDSPCVLPLGQHGAQHEITLNAELRRSEARRHAHATISSISTKDQPSTFKF